MKYRLPLNDHNKDILIQVFNAEPQKLETDYWLKILMADEEQVLAVLNNRKGARDPQRRLINRSNKLRRKYINELTGLPKMNGSGERKRIYNNFYKQYNFTRV